MYVRPGAKAQLIPRDPRRDAQGKEIQRSSEQPDHIDDNHQSRMKAAFFPASDDPEFRWLVLPCSYRWADKHESQVRPGLYYSEFTDYWSGTFCLVQDPAGSDRAILLLSNGESSIKSLRHWVTSTAMAFCAGPTVRQLTRNKHGRLSVVDPKNLQFGREFQSQSLIVGDKLQIELLTDLLRAMMYNREFAVVVS